MAEVWRVRDLLLGARVAMKICRADVGQDPELRRRFEDEARLTAQLRHPGIPAVHDMGVLPDGRPYFTLEEVRGQTLAEAITRHREGARRWTLRRLVELLVRACQAVAYAHDNRTLHRDLKPENIMVGDFGQVHVMDWGLARPLHCADPEGDVQLVRTLGTSTHVGTVLGTPAYMAPEQARGAVDVGPEVDVYGLGAILYTILSGGPPYSGDAGEVWRARMAGPPAPLDAALHPAPLVALVERCMASSPRDRLAESGEVAAALDAWLDGTWREEQAARHVAESEALAVELADLRAAIQARRAEAAAVLAPLQPYDPVAQKAPGWALDAEADALELRHATLETRRLLALRQALGVVPDHPPAHDQLADHHATELLAAEAKGDALALARSEALLREHDRGRHAGLLRREGWLDLVTDPPGALVRCAAVVDRLGRSVEEPRAALGHTPLRCVALPAGSYVLTLERVGHHPVRYPVRIARDQRWDGAPPGAGGPWVLPLPVLGSLGADECYVPAGPTWVGGDPNALDAPPRTRMWIPGFVMRRHPVTNRDYLGFLNDRVACGLPIADVEPAAGVEGAAYRRDTTGTFVMRSHEPGGTERPDWPVTQVTWSAAVAFAEHVAARDRLPWRLPHEWEWEKAARGVDGRFMPWGDRVEPTWAAMFGSQPGPPVRASVHEHPTDESPYGVRGTAGNVRDWCANVWRRCPPELATGRLDPLQAEAEGIRASRGGAWSSMPNFCRAANRFGGPAEARFHSLGFRLVRSWP